MDPEHESLQKMVSQHAKQVDRDRDIESVFKTAQYGRTEFEGKLKPEHQVTEMDILCWMDDLPFGGQCTINGLEFYGRYNTD